MPNFNAPAVAPSVAPSPVLAPAAAVPSSSPEPHPHSAAAASATTSGDAARGRSLRNPMKRSPARTSISPLGRTNRHAIYRMRDSLARTIGVEPVSELEDRRGRRRRQAAERAVLDDPLLLRDEVDA